MVRTVVVVDDDLHTVDILQLFLSIRGLDVVAFERADGVVEAIHELKPDVAANMSDGCTRASYSLCCWSS
jgi:DNA-binding response OmpR family regulator